VNVRVAVVIGAVIVVIGGIVLLLASGDPSGDLGSPSEFADASGDVDVAEGPEPPPETELADIVDADVRTSGASVVFRAEMARDIPQRVKGGSMSWRWDIYEGDTGTWILSANLDTGPTAFLTSTQTNYGSSTFDDTLPGRLELDGNTLTITLRPDEVKRWPDDFQWTLGTELDGAQGNPRSALAKDAVPDQGRGELES
jgi:hypothetical protein